jgi:hypothetical protein
VHGQSLGRRRELCGHIARRPSARLFALGQHYDEAGLLLEVEHVGRPNGYERWLSQEPNPRDLLITYPSEPMVMWPISTRVNKPEDDDPSLLELINDAQFDDLSPSKRQR